MDDQITPAPQKKSSKMLIIISLAVGLIVVGGIVMFVNGGTKKTESNQSTQSTTSNNQPSQIEAKTFTKDDVAVHNTKSDCWTIIEDSVYDLTSFIGRHPGGEEILRACGTDGTSLFTERKTEDGQSVGSGTPHSSSASSQLQDLKIGNLKQ